jgi:NADH-quinone oxidoreductase subunit A
MAEPAISSPNSEGFEKLDILSQFSNVLLFLFAGVAFVLGALIVGVFFRPSNYDRDKARIYECGEPTIGSSWIRYNIRFYTVALVFLVFDVEVVMLLPVAAVLRELGYPALFEVLFFIGILAVGFIYAWRFGHLDWIRTFSPESSQQTASLPTISALNSPATPVKEGGNA